MDWSFRVDPPASGPENMKIDTALLLLAERSPQAFTCLRFYSWKTPTVSLGKHQLLEQCVDHRYCREEGIPVVRRPTGGRAVWHQTELTYAIVSNDARFFPRGSVAATYGRVAAALQAGLRELGIRTQLSAAPAAIDAVAPRGRGKDPCFVSAARHELLFQGRKMVGSAQRRLRNSFLQHGSIPLRVNYQRMAQVLGVGRQRLEASLVSVSEACGCRVSFRMLCQALREGFQGCFEVRLEEPPAGRDGAGPCASEIASRGTIGYTF